MHINLAQRVAERQLQTCTQKFGAYVLLSNIYAFEGMWDKVGEIRKLMIDRGVNKEPGISWIQIKNELHSFLTTDHTHHQLTWFDVETVARGAFKQDVTFQIQTLFFMTWRKKKSIMHFCISEKIAVAFGIMNTPNGSPIQIMKNLHISGDCHT